MNQVAYFGDNSGGCDLPPERLENQVQQAQTRDHFVNQLVFAALVMVALASIYDAWLVFKFRAVIDEENLLCRWLISLEPEYVSIFLTAKLTGTALVVATVGLLMRFWRRVAVPTVIGLVAFQIGLMFYLHTYDSVEAHYRLAHVRASKVAMEVADSNREPSDSKAKQKEAKSERTRRKQRATRGDLRSQSRNRMAAPEKRVRPRPTTDQRT